MRGDVDEMKREGGKKEGVAEEEKLWKDKPLPPLSLIEYILSVRSHCLDRSFSPLPPYQAGKEAKRHISGSDPKSKPPSRHALLAGMSAKKQHEVSNFARQVADLAERVSTAKGGKGITHIIDFGSGQNYLGRVLASEPYCKHIIAVESRPHVVEGAKKMDLKAKLGEKKVVLRDKKKFKEMGGWKALNESLRGEVLSKETISDKTRTSSDLSQKHSDTVRANLKTPGSEQGS